MRFLSYQVVQHFVHHWYCPLLNYTKLTLGNGRFLAQNPLEVLVIPISFLKMLGASLLFDGNGPFRVCLLVGGWWKIQDVLQIGLPIFT